MTQELRPFGGIDPESASSREEVASAPHDRFGGDLLDDASALTAIMDLPVVAGSITFNDSEGEASQTGIFATEGQGEARSLILAAQHQLDSAADPASRARLHHQLALLLECRLGDFNSALLHHQAAWELQPTDLVHLRGLRALCEALQSWTSVLSLIEAELELRSDPVASARLLAEKGEILQEWLANDGLAVVAYQAALQRDPGNSHALHRLRSLLSASGEDLYGVLELCRHAINATADRRLRAQLYGQMAELQLLVHPEAERAIESFAVAFVEDPANARARESLKLLYERSGRWGDLVDVLLTEGDLADSEKQRATLYLRAARLCRDQLGQIERAIDLLDRVKDIGADHLVLQELSDLLLEAGRHEDLIAVYQQRIRVASHSDERAPYHLMLGELLELRMGRLEEATFQYRAAFDADPTVGAAAEALERVYRQRGRWRELVDLQLQQMGRLALPEQQAALAITAADLCERRMGDLARAITCHRRALGACEGHEIARRELVRLYLQTGAFAEALPLMEQAAQSAEDAAAIALYMEAGALAEQRLGDLERAASSYSKVLEREPKHLGAIQALQRTRGALGDDAELLRYLDLEADLRGDSHVATLRLRAAALCEERGLFEEAEQRYRRLRDASPQDSVVVAAIARLLTQRGDWEGLASYCIEQLERCATGGERAAWRCRLGELYELRLHQTEHAVASYQQALAEDERSTEALGALIRLYRQTEQWPELVGVLELAARAAESLAHRASLVFAIGEIYQLRLADRQEAIERYRHTLQVSSDHHAARDALLALLISDERFAEAIEVLEVSISKRLELHIQVLLLKQLARLRIRVGDKERAIVAMQEALALDARDGEMLIELASLYRETGQYHALVTCLNRLADVTEDPGDRVRLLFEAATCAEAYLPLERDPAPFYRSVLDLTPHDQRAVAALLRIYRERDDTAALIAALELQRGLADNPVEQVGLLLRLSAAHETEGDLVRAGSALEEAVALSPDWLVLRELRRLQERLGNWRGVAETLEQEAVACWDDGEAAKTLVDAASLYLDRLDDAEAGIRVLCRLLERVPFHEEASNRLEQVLVQRGDWTQMVEISEARLRVAGSAASPQSGGSQQAQIDLLVRVAWIQREYLAAPAAAVAGLKRALEIDAQHISTLLTLAELHVELEQWHEATAAFSRLVELSDDADLLLKAHMQLGDIWCQHLKDTRRAISSYQNVLAIEPKQRVAMRRLADLFRAEGEWDNASDAFTRLLEVERSHEAQVAHHTALAEICEYGLRELDAAVHHCQQALVIDPTNEAVVGRLADLLTRLSRWEPLVDALRSHLCALPATRQANSVARRMQLADVLYRHLHRHGEALEQYRIISEMDPSDIASRLRAARLLVEQGRADEAIHEHRAVLELDPTSTEALSDLRAIYSRRGDKELAYVTASVLVCIAAASEAEHRVYREYRAAGVRAPQAPLDAATFASSVMHPAEQHGGRAILGVLADVAHRLRPKALSQWQVGKGDRLSARSDDPLLGTVRHVGATLGLDWEPDVYSSQLRPREMGLLLLDPPALVIGSGVTASRSSRQVRFAVAALLTYLRNRTWFVKGIEAQELACWITAARRVVDPSVVLPPEIRLAEVEECVDTLQRHLSRRSRRALEDAVQLVQQESTPSFEEWLIGARMTALRAALWVVNDLETGLDHLRHCDSALALAKSPLQLATAYREHRLARELISYWLSDELLRAKGGAVSTIERML